MKIEQVGPILATYTALRIHPTVTAHGRVRVAWAHVIATAMILWGLVTMFVPALMIYRQVRRQQSEMWQQGRVRVYFLDVGMNGKRWFRV